MGRKSAKPKAKVERKTLPAQAKLDFPDSIWEKAGRKENDRLLEKRRQGKKLSPLEEHLILRYFPAQQKRVQKAKQSMETGRENQRSESVERAKQARKENRRDERDQHYARKV